MLYLLMYLRWFGLMVIDVLTVILNIFAAPFVALFGNEAGYLPRWLWWFQTPDNPLDGDEGWQTKHWQWRFKLPALLRVYAGRLGWLWRNSMYGFAIDVLGAHTLGTDLMVIYGDPLISNRPIRSGWCYRVLYRDDKPLYWQFYFVWQWSETRCVRINIGWKLWSFRTGQAVNCQFVFSPNPLMGLSVV